MYPLSNWKNLRKGYRFKEKTFYSKYHLGLDLIIPTGTKIRVPFDGEIIRQFNGKQGGLTVWLKYEHYIIRFLHNSRYGKKGKVKEGDVIAYSGNTGSRSRGAHSHIDISKNSVQLNNINNFINPEKFNWDNNMYNVKSDLKNEIEKITKDDYGKVMTKKEQKKAAKKLKKYRKDVEKAKYDLEQNYWKDISEEREKWENALEKEIKKNERFSQTIGNYHTEVKRLNGIIINRNKEINELKELKAKNYKAIGILSRFAEALRMVLAFKK